MRHERAWSTLKTRGRACSRRTCAAMMRLGRATASSPWTSHLMFDFPAPHPQPRGVGKVYFKGASHAVRREPCEREARPRKCTVYLHPVALQAFAF